MENASKALLIAGEILLGMMVLAILVFLNLNMGETASTYERQISAQEIDRFNSYFNQFGSRTDITPQEVVSAVQYAKDCNGSEPIITVTVKGYSGNVGDSRNTSFNEVTFMQNNNKPDARKAYKCSVTYDNTTGMIKTVSFTY